MLRAVLLGGVSAAALVLLSAMPASAQSIVVTGDVSPADIPGPVWVIESGDLVVGSSGPGSLSIMDGGFLENVSAYVGQSGNGSVIVSGTNGSGNASTWTNTGLLSIGGGANGVLTVTAGGVVTSNSAALGGGTSSATVTVSGEGSTFILGTNIVMSGTEGGNVTFGVQDGGRVVADAVHLASGINNLTISGSAGARGVLEVGQLSKAGGSAMVNFDGGVLRLAGDQTDLFAGFDSADVRILGGGMLIDTQGFAVSTGYGLGGTGRLTKIGAGTLTLTGSNSYTGGTTVREGTLAVTGGGSIAQASMIVGDQSGDDGTLEIGAGGSVHSSTGTIGSADGSVGKSVVAGTGAQWTMTGSLTVGDEGEGTLEIGTGGTVSSTLGWIGRGDGSVGKVTVAGAGAAWILPDSLSVRLTVGNNGDGTLEIGAGGSVSSSWTVLGSSADGEGTLTVAGAGAILTTDRLDIGYNGTGALEITAGGTVVSNAPVRIALNTDSIGTALVSGSGSSWTTADNIIIGHLGEGTMRLAQGALVSVGDGAGGVGNGVLRLGTDAVTPVGVAIFVIGGASGEAAEAAGTLEAGEVQFGSGNGTGTLVFNHTGNPDGSDLAFAPEITGAGPILHENGTTVLTGDSAAFAGTTTVSGGALIVGNETGGSLGGVLDVAAGALLGGVGAVGGTGAAVTIAAGGVHAPGNSIGVQTVLGDYANHGTLRIEATPGAADGIIVHGAVDITGAILELQLSPLTPGDWEMINGPNVIIDNRGPAAVTGTFASVEQNLIFLDVLLDYMGGDGNDVTLTLARNNVGFADVAETPNQQATAAALATLDTGDPVWLAVATGTDADLVRAGFDALSGELHASVKTGLIEDGRLVRDALNRRLGAGSDTPDASEIPVLGYWPSADFASAPSGHAGTGLWIEGFGALGAIASDGNAAAFERAAGGVLAGADGLVGDWRLGLLAGYGQSRFEARDRASSGSSETYHLGLYGGTQWDALALRTGLAHSWHQIGTQRSVEIGAISESLTAGYGAGTFQAFGELGYAIEAGAVAFEPFANLAHARLDTDGFTEEGGATALSGEGGTAHVTVTTLGLRAEAGVTLGTIEATARAMLGWQHAFGDTTPGSTHTLAGSDPFTIAGAPMPRDSAIVEAGLDLKLSPGATLGFSYNGQIAADAENHAMTAGFVGSF